jgi:uncharacterized membrane protein
MLMIALWTARLLALVGFVDATYLTVSHLGNSAVACGSGGCDTVLTSEYASIGGVPLAAVGIGYYVVASLLAWTPPGGWSRTNRSAFLGLTGIALAFSGVLVALQAFVIDAWCRFCLLSAAVTLALFTCAVILSRVPPERSIPGIVEEAG